MLFVVKWLLHPSNRLDELDKSLKALDDDINKIINMQKQHDESRKKLDQTGRLEHSWISNTYGFICFYQLGKNGHGDVLMVFRPGFSVKRVPCRIPNVCVVDLLTDLSIRVIGIYAPESKTWEWNELSPFITPSCVLFGDFNIDIEKDGEKSRILLDWADMCFLAPIRPDTDTSLRSEHTIDYAFTVGVPLSASIGSWHD
ncbi:unnamed protein product [Didymodactylos carnosus]|uniref:Endonuclease/exonuclease/phosphatase domain-containing protein n=1 Tax=Didymodactylos carnosus TaxID=1234261 RepID=A0A8S2M2G9_9BILA|nr:unnamed protein product [Didymodactylos carnosus]CAF3920596.1 unnamed protein product [Didymodactylos carnosus]